MEQTTSESRKDVNVRTAQLVQLLTELGPDIPEIARRLGQFKESVRYRYKEKILNRGFAVQAMPDHERLGLERMVATARFSEEYAKYAQTILTVMSEVCFVVSYAKSLPTGDYVVNMSVPREHCDEVRGFLRNLEQKGMFTSLKVMQFEWVRNAPMKAEFYDFDTGRWDFDWAGSSLRDFRAAAYMPSQSAKYDLNDLLIIKELQKDANKTLTEIANDLKLNYKKLAWHYNTHVLGKHLIRGYRVNWMGTRYDFRAERALHRKHRYLGVDLFVSGTSEYEKAILGKRVGQLPFLWAEAGGRNYFAEIAFPVDYVVEGLQYIEDTISGMKDRAEVSFIDQSNSVAFSIPYKLYDETQKRWTFNGQDLTVRFDNLIQQVKKETG